MFLDEKIKQTIKQALKEDIGKKDITTALSIPADIEREGVIIAKQKGVLCGIEIVRDVFRQLDKKMVFKSFRKEGDTFKKGEKIAVVKGKARIILIGERTALNFLSLLSGVATSTRNFIDKVKGLKVKIMDTRKTFPNLRKLEKYAVRTGGGYNHRSSLSEGILVKDNHLKAIGCISKRRLKKDKISQLILSLKSGTSLQIEIEVENLEELREIAEHKPDIIMLDNFLLKDLKTAVRLRDKYFPKIKLEASGGINLINVRAVARTGVDFISAGIITHSPQAVDFSLEIR